MLNFTRLNKDNIFEISQYFALSHVKVSDLSIGVRYMWEDKFKTDFAFYKNSLILRETSSEYTKAYYLPIVKSEEEFIPALLEIEKYCKEVGEPLKFCYIDEKALDFINKRYPFNTSSYKRNWCDYIYLAENFKTYAGKKLSGQRNHVNKFKKLYPDYKFKVLSEDNIDKAYQFLQTFVDNANPSVFLEKEEAVRVQSFVKNCLNLNQVGGFIELDGKMVALSVGERVGDTLVIHVEKALKEYVGIYPTMAQEFAKAFATEGVLYTNREEDCGDLGLRTSKTQYKPIEIKQKNVVNVFTAFEKICTPNLTTERLTITDILESDKEDYYQLYINDDNNKYWGYDYREDCLDTPTPDYFYNFQQSLKDKKEEYSLAVRLNGKMIGEIVLWNFGYDGSVETGFRFFKEYQGKGYAFESVFAVINYEKQVLGVKKVKTRCNKLNAPSYKMINRLGFTKSHEDDINYYFEQ